MCVELGYRPMMVNTKMDQRAGGHRWPFDGSRCAVCGMTAAHFADTKERRRGPQPDREQIAVPDDDVKP